MFFVANMVILETKESAISPLASATDENRSPDAERRYHHRPHHSEASVWFTDRVGKILFADHRLAQLLGYTVTEMVGRGWLDFVFPEDREQAQARLDGSWRGQCERFDFRLRHKNDAEVLVTARTCPNSNDLDQISGVIGIFTNIVEQDKARQTLREGGECLPTERSEIEIERDTLLMREQAARRQAEAATRARDDFLRVMSHELRSPLSGIQSWAHVLESQLPTQSAVVQRALQGIKTGVAQQVRLIEDLLDVMGMMGGKLRLAKRPLALLPVVQAVVASVAPLASTKRIAIETAYDISAEQIDGDPDRLQQIIWNLLSNAVKFTPYAGRIWVRAFTCDGSACVSVCDNGIGITADFLPHLFHRFHQADATSTRAHGGLGLGLSMARHLVELHGGRITAQSAGEGKGATFSVFFPLVEGLGLNPAAAAQTSLPVAPSLQNVKILLVDDQEEARESLTTLLRHNGAQVITVASGDEALRSLECLQAAQLPQILLCDIAMPEEDGYSVLRRVRAWRSEQAGSSLQQLPAVALTAFAENDDRVRALTAGFQMYLAKPVAPHELVAVIAGLTRRV